MARPSQFTAERAQTICDRLAEGQPLTAICRDMGLAWRTVYDWRTKHSEFGEAFEIARQIGYDAIAESCIDIADNDDAEADPQRDKLRVWTRLQLLSKWSPKKYSEKLDLSAQVNGTFTVVSGVPRANG
jgi:transposase-like protein